MVRQRPAVTPWRRERLYTAPHLRIGASQVRSTEVGKNKWIPGVIHMNEGENWKQTFNKMCSRVFFHWFLLQTTPFDLALCFNCVFIYSKHVCTALLQPCVSFSSTKKKLFSYHDTCSTCVFYLEKRQHYVSWLIIF